MRERELEKLFASSVKKSGGIAIKLVSPGFDGMQVYGFSTKMTESECVAELFKLYQQKVKEGNK